MMMRFVIAGDENRGWKCDCRWTTSDATWWMTTKARSTGLVNGACIWSMNVNNGRSQKTIVFKYVEL